MYRSSLQPMWNLTIHPLHDPSSSLAQCTVPTFLLRLNVFASTPPSVHPLRGSASSLAHHPVFGSDTICYRSNPPLANIVLFGLSLKVFKTYKLERVSTQEYFIPISNRCGISQEMPT